MRREAGQLYAAIRPRAEDAFAEAQSHRRCADGKGTDGRQAATISLSSKILFNIANKVKHTKIVLLCRQYVPQWDKICRSTGAEVISPLGLKNLINNRPNLQLAMEVRYLTSVVPKLGGQSRLSSRG